MIQLTQPIKLTLYHLVSTQNDQFALYATSPKEAIKLTQNLKHNAIWRVKKARTNKRQNTHAKRKSPEHTNYQI